MLRLVIFLTLLILSGNSKKTDQDEDIQRNEATEEKEVGQFKDSKISDTFHNSSLPIIKNIESLRISGSSNNFETKKDLCTLEANEPDTDIDYKSADNIDRDNKIIENQIMPRGNELNKAEILPDSRRILPGIIKNPTSEELDYNKLIKNKTQFRRKGNDQGQSISHDIERIKNNDDDLNVAEINENETPSLKLSFPPKENYIENQLVEPTKGKGIFNVKNTKVMLLENSRICYACSTMSDPTCWSPDSRTTAKYCHKGHNSCLSKSFNYKGTSFIVRDCGSYCVNSNGNQYSTCSICHTDLCNSASNIATSSIAIIVVFAFLINIR